MARIAQIKSARLQPDHHLFVSHIRHSPDTPYNLDTSDSDTDTPFLPYTAVSSFSCSGISWLTTDASRPTFSSVDCWLISEWRIWDIDTCFKIRALMGERGVNFLIRWLPEQYINRDADAYWRPQIDGDRDRWCLFQILDINIHLLIDRSIYLSINRRTKRRKVHISRTSYSMTHWQDRQKGCINRTDGCKNR